MDIIKRISKISLFFVYLYPVTFVFFPFLHTRNILALIGIILVLWKFNIAKFVKLGNEGLLYLFFFSTNILFSCAANGTSDYSLIGLPFTFLLTAFSFWGVYQISGKPSIEKNVEYMAIACVIQAFIGLFFFLNPPVKEFVYSFVKINELAEESLMQSAGFRLHGLGANFFSAGVTNCAILVLCAIFVLSNKRLFIICFIIIAILGSCMSRTTMVGGAIALPVLLYNIGTVSKTKLIVTLALIVAAFSLILRYAANSNEDSIYALYAFGAELLINLEEKGSVMSSGVEALDYASHMPESFWTYIIGDGLYADPKNPTTAYYMGVDQGYLRMLYYVGLIGLTFRLLSYLSFFKKICIMNKSKEFYFLFAVYLIAMYKGDTDIFQFIVPLYFIPLISFRK